VPHLDRPKIFGENILFYFCKIQAGVFILLEQNYSLLSCVLRYGANLASCENAYYHTREICPSKVIEILIATAEKYIAPCVAYAWRRNGRRRNGETPLLNLDLDDRSAFWRMERGNSFSLEGVSCPRIGYL